MTSHFATDLDIRMKDPRYKQYQSELLKKRAEAIRAKYELPNAETANGNHG